jgi:hypothetical protein
MATPTNLPAAFVAGNILEAAQLNALRGAFRILQVVEGKTSTSATSSSATYVDTNLTVTITPQFSTSKILVIASQAISTSASANSAGLRIVRGSTTLTQNSDIAYNATGGGIIISWQMMNLDSPATTSATTYKTTFARTFGGGSVTANPAGNDASIIVMEISA